MVEKMEKILVVDDSGFARKIIIGILERNGYKNIVKASSGVEAIAKYEEENLNLVLLDLLMPGMGGVEVLEKIMEKDPEANVIVVTALGQEPIVTKSIKIGAKGYVIKPIDEKKLINEIKRALQSPVE